MNYARIVNGDVSFIGTEQAKKRPTSCVSFNKMQENLSCLYKETARVITTRKEAMNEQSNYS